MKNEVVKGSVVVATAGKEKNQLFVVVDVKENFVFLADGKRLKLIKPKKKSVKHVQKASTKKFPVEDLSIKDEKFNTEIRNFLKNL